MENRVVVDELDIAALQIHVETQISPARLLVEKVECFLLQRRQWHAALHRASVDLVSDEPTAHDAVAIAEDRDRPLGHAALRQRRLAADVVEAVVEQPEVLRMLREDLVVHRDRADDAAEPALERAAQTE